MNHIAVFNSSTLQTKFVDNLLKGNEESLLSGFEGKKGALFSLSVLKTFLAEEKNYGRFTLTENHIDGNGNVRKLGSFSSGQQKKLLLDYLANQEFDFLVLDNPFDFLDVQNQDALADDLAEISSRVALVQLFKVRDEVLPFVEEYYFIENDAVQFSGISLEYDEFFHSKLKPYEFKGSLPQPLKSCEIQNPLVKFTDVNIFYEQTRQIVCDINWEIKKGEFWHLKGRNGAGKTSLLTMITGDNPKAFGEDIVLFGRQKGSGETVWDLKKNIGHFSPALTQSLGKLFTVQQMVLSGFYDSVGLYEKPTGQEIVEADKWLDLVGLKEKKQTYFVRLSPEIQRVILIIRAMVKYPPLLILDEPTNELDDYTTAMLTAFVDKIHKETDTSIIYVSHRMLKGLSPDKVFELIPTDKGSIGVVHE